jgi:phosphohistidine phosphatase
LQREIRTQVSVAAKTPKRTRAKNRSGNNQTRLALRCPYLSNLTADRANGDTAMNLILWRHAEAEDIAASDLARQLTTRGRKQAQASAKWLRARLPDDAVILASPATRTVQTAESLTDQYRVVREIAPDASAAAVLEAAGWPDGIAPTVVIVGHQPTLGHVAARLLADSGASWSIKKSAIWWIESRVRGSDGQAILRAVITPDLI